MSIIYEITSSLRLVYLRMPKTLSIAELVSHMEDLVADENYIPPMKKIVDFTYITDSPMPKFDVGDFSRLKAFYEDKLRGEHCVFVAPSNFMFGMARLFQGFMHNASLEVSVVRSLEEALELLHIDEEDFRAAKN
jgi:hypothetical protein